jgi:LysM repeat protein/pyruvate-formate lyase-activating enzyme
VSVESGGCALACTFCATGQFGFDRHLEAGEIVAQLAYAAPTCVRPHGGCPDRVSNVVFMGMGEPLANYDRVRESLRRMIEVMGLSARSITVSTVGVVPGMRRLADEPWQVNLAVSLHAADDELRSRLLPINRRYPLAEVEDAAAEYFEKKGRRVSLEWTMIDGVNDSDDQAIKLAPIARRLKAHVNLIAMNPTPLTDSHPSSQRRIAEFVDTLRDHGVNVTVRDTRGRDIDAACGQLRAREESKTNGVDRIAPAHRHRLTTDFPPSRNPGIVEAAEIRGTPPGESRRGVHHVRQRPIHKPARRTPTAGNHRWCNHRLCRHRRLGRLHRSEAATPLVRSPASTGPPSRRSAMPTASPIPTGFERDRSSPSPGPAPAAESVRHKVKRGESLSEIAARYRVSVSALVRRQRHLQSERDQDRPDPHGSPWKRRQWERRHHQPRGQGRRDAGHDRRPLRNHRSPSWPS